jgi:hypothetical protein
MVSLLILPLSIKFADHGEDTNCMPDTWLRVRRHGRSLRAEGGRMALIARTPANARDVRTTGPQETFHFAVFQIRLLFMSHDIL